MSYALSYGLYERESSAGLIESLLLLHIRSTVEYMINGMARVKHTAIADSLTGLTYSFPPIREQYTQRSITSNNINVITLAPIAKLALKIDPIILFQIDQCSLLFFSIFLLCNLLYHETEEGSQSFMFI